MSTEVDEERLREAKEWAHNNWHKLNEYVGACPECGQANEDLNKLAKEAVLTGIGIPVIDGIFRLVDNLDEWPRPIVADEAIKSVAPLEIECQTDGCDTTYQP